MPQTIAESHSWLFMLAATFALAGAIIEALNARKLIARWTCFVLLSVSVELACYALLLGGRVPSAGRGLVATQLVAYLFLDFSFMIAVIYYSGRSAWIRSSVLVPLFVPVLAAMILLLAGWNRLPTVLAFGTAAFGLESRFGRFPAIGLEALVIAYAFFSAFVSLGLALTARPGLSERYRWTNRGLALLSASLVAIGLLEVGEGNPFLKASILQVALALASPALLLLVSLPGTRHSIPLDLNVLKDAMKDGYLVLDAHGDIVDFNRALAELVGSNAGLAIGAGFSATFPSLALSARQAAGEGGRDGPTALFAVGGMVYEVSFHPVGEGHRSGIGTMVVFHGVSGRDELEGALRLKNIALSRTNSLLTSLSRLSELAQRSGDPSAVMAGIGTAFGEGGISSFVALLGDDPPDLEVRDFHIAGGEGQAIENFLGSRIKGFRLERGLFGPLYEALADGKVRFTRGETGAIGAWFSQTPAWLARLLDSPSGIRKSDKSVIIPIASGGSSFGLIGLWGQEIEEGDAGLLALFGRTLGWTLERAELGRRDAGRMEELNRSNSIITTLAAMAARVQDSTDSDSALASISEGLPSLGLSWAIALLDEGKEEATIRHVSFTSEVFAAVEGLLGFRLAGHLIPQEYWPEDRSVFQGRAVWYEDVEPVFLKLFSGVPAPIARAAYNIIRGKQRGRLCFIPLKASGEVVGVMPVWGRDLEPRDEPALRIFGEQVGGLLHRNVLLESERTRAAELERTNTMVLALSKVASCLDLSSVLPDFYASLGGELRKIGIECMIGILDDEAQSMKVHYLSVADRVSATARKVHLHVPEELVIPRRLWPTDRAVAQKQPSWDPDPVGSTARMFPLAPRQLLVKSLEAVGMGASDQICYLPMMGDDRVFGVFAVWGPTLRKDDLPALGVFTNQVSSAMRKADLFQQAQKELAERKEAEKRLLDTVAEKDTLLKEVHHRVKNNLQVVSSLLRLQAGRMRDEEAIAGFNDSQDRIRAMALIHEKLYQSKNTARVDFTAYLSSLVMNLSQSYRVAKVKVSVTGDPVELDIDTAIPCGLIVNELVTNAFKYAFGDDRKGSLDVGVSLIGPGTCRLRVKDDGPGLPPGFDHSQGGTLGFLLVTSLARQLDGKLRLESASGLDCAIDFPLHQHVGG